MEVTYLCGVTNKKVKGTADKLPEGWMLPPSDVSQDIEKPVPPPHTIIAISSKEAWNKLLKSRLENK